MDEKSQEPYYLRNDGGHLSGVQCNSLASLVHHASALCRRPERRPPSFGRRVVFLSFPIPLLFLSFILVAMAEETRILHSLSPFDDSMYKWCGFHVLDNVEAVKGKTGSQ